MRLFCCWLPFFILGHCNCNQNCNGNLERICSFDLWSDFLSGKTFKCSIFNFQIWCHTLNLKIEKLINTSETRIRRSWADTAHSLTHSSVVLTRSVHTQDSTTRNSHVCAVQLSPVSGVVCEQVAVQVGSCLRPLRAASLRRYVGQRRASLDDLLSGPEVCGGGIFVGLKRSWSDVVSLDR